MDSEKIEEILAREDLQIAPIWKRVLAFLVDELLISMLIFAVYYESMVANANNQEAVIVMLSSAWFVLYGLKTLYQWLFVALYGATIGKIVMKIKVIEVELLDIPSYGRSFLRACLRMIGEFLFWIPFLLVFEKPIRQALHDKFSKTVVINLA